MRNATLAMLAAWSGFASGMPLTAMFLVYLAIVTLMGAGAHIVAASALYGGTHNLLAYTLPRFGIETTFVDTRDPEAFRAAIRPETRVLFAETLGNPGLDVLDIPAVAEVAHWRNSTSPRSSSA